MKPQAAILMACLSIMILLVGCGGNERYEVTIEFPQTSSDYQDATETLRIYSVLPIGENTTCQDLMNGIHKPRDDGYSVEDEKVFFAPFAGTIQPLKVATDNLSKRLFFVEGEDTNGTVILRGCTDVIPRESHTVTVPLVMVCTVGFGDCDGNFSTGCESDLSADTDHCGSCDRACSNGHGSTECLVGICAPTCDSGFSDCDGNPRNGCESTITCNGHGTCSIINGSATCFCSEAYSGLMCDRCESGALGKYPNCFLAPTQDYCVTSQCFLVSPTGQTSCYNASDTIPCPGGGDPPLCGENLSAVRFCGQDAQYPFDRFFTCYNADGSIQGPCASSAQPDEVVTDSVTGLMWQRTYIASQTWQHALEYCADLLYAGYNDWYLPSVRDLMTIIDHSRYDPVINTAVFPGTPSGWFWSSTCPESGSAAAYFVDFTNGDNDLDGKEFSYAVRCVRHGWTQLKVGTGNRFIASGESDPVVMDAVTGLMWQKNYNTKPCQSCSAPPCNWENTLRYCESLNYGSYTDWRLPNINELMSLINYGRSNPSSDFPGMPSIFFVSSSSSLISASYAWGVGFQSGSLNHSTKTSVSSVLCVRGGRD